MLRKYLPALLALALAAPAAADTLVLTSGAQLEGKLIKKEGGKVVFQLAQGQATFPAADVAKIIPGKTRMERYEERASALTFTDAKGHFALAQWCKAERLHTQHLAELELVCEIEPDHEQARKALGHVKVRGEWLTKSEAMKALGYVRYMSKWMRPEEIERMKSSGEHKTRVAKLQKSANKIMKRIADKDDMKRKIARDDLLAFAKINELPDLVDVANKLYKKYTDYWVERRYVTTEIRATKATVTQPIKTVTTSTGQGNAGGTGIISIEVPEIEMVKIGTTVTIPAGTGP